MWPSRVIRANQYATVQLISLLIAVSPLSAMQSQPIRVIDVQSPLRVNVEAMIGGLPTTIILQLEGIRLIGPPEHALNKLKELCPPGCEVILELPGPRLETDAVGLAKAWVMRDIAPPIDPASQTPQPGTRQPRLTSLQVELMRSGWAVMDDQPTTHPVSPHLAMQARQAMEEARTRRMGAYSLPGFQAPPLVGGVRGQAPSDIPVAPVETPVSPVPAGANGF